MSTPNDNDGVFRSLDLIVERINRHAVEPLFSIDVSRRATTPSFGHTDADIMKRMIILIAFSQGAQSRLIDRMIQQGVFESVFPSFAPTDIACLDPDDLRARFWIKGSSLSLTPMRYPKKLVRMIDCARRLKAIASDHGSFMSYLATAGLPTRVDSPSNEAAFWNGFDEVRHYLQKIDMPFFKEFTSLCHLFQDLGFDVAKPDDIVMNVAKRLGIVTKNGEADRRRVVQLMQSFSIYKGIRTPVVDLYFLIEGGQTDATKFVSPSFYLS